MEGQFKNVEERLDGLKLGAVTLNAVLRKKSRVSKVASRIWTSASMEFMSLSNP